MNTADHLLATIEAHPSTLREGVDSLALLYKWRRQGGDGTGFMAAIQSLHSDGLVEILPGEDMRLRLTVAGFERLDALLPEDNTESDVAADSDTDEAAWRGPATHVRETPEAELAGTLLQVFATLAVPVGHAVSADTLSKIWTMEGKRGGDLRTALDALAAAGALVIHRGERTMFALTESGAVAVAAAQRRNQP